MREPAAGDVALACVSLLVDELARGGVSGASVAPGSRSTAIALALERHPDVEVHVHLDERSAGFFAVGLAKATGSPAVVACTSGTATANLFPAVVEAAQAGVPLIVLTADRPPELRGTGANQTIDQTRLFGVYPTLYVEADVPEARIGAAGYWRSLGALAVRAAGSRPRGPVHVNLPFVEPLTPTGAAVDLGDDEASLHAAPVADAEPGGAVRDLEELVASHERGVIVAGSLTDDATAVAALARAAGWPLIAEPMSGLRTPGDALAAGYWLVADERFAADHRPDVVLQFGAAPTSRAALAFVASAERLVVITEDGRPADPARRASWTFRASPDGLAGTVAARLTRRSNRWPDVWRAADAAARDALDRSLDASEEAFEGRVARDLAAHLADGATLVAASSMPVRDLDAYAAPRRGLRVLANRGASGIDGFVSTVLGVAASGAPTFALTGDLSLLHDAGALIWSARRGYDAVFVVVNNDGGGVFDLLPSASLPEHEKLFVTPHGLDLNAIAEAAGAGYERVSKASALTGAVSDAHRRGGVAIVEVEIDRAEAVLRRRALSAVIRETLAQT